MIRRLLAAWRHWREVREFDRAYKRGTAVEITTPPDGIRVVPESDWIGDPSLSVAEKMRRFEALHPQWTSGPFRLVSTPPTCTSGASTSTWIYKEQS